MRKKRRRRYKRKHHHRFLKFLIALFIAIGGYVTTQYQQIHNSVASLEEVPQYDGKPYVIINDNQPLFQEDELTTQSFEKYSPLDALGRCQVAYANVSQETMPTQKRESIGMIKPTGWQIQKYDFIDGKYLYNRCHLIGYQLTGENANERNLITGTRYMNTEGMLPFENQVADYIQNTNHHVLYRVTPIFEGNNLLASGVLMEAMSVEDQGRGLSFYVFVYNVQPHVKLNYQNGKSCLEKDT